MTHWFSILKAPWDARRRGWKKPTYWAANPEAIKVHVMSHEYGASSFLPQQGYEGMSLFSNKLTDPTFEPPHDLPSNSWQPRQYLEEGRVGAFNVFNWREEDMVNPEWELMQLSSDDPEYGAEMHGSFTGANTIPLEPDEIGIMVSQTAPTNKETEKVEWAKASMEVDLFYPKSSTWFGEGRARDAAKYGKDPQHGETGPDRMQGGIQQLTNAEGAILWIYANIKNLKEKKKTLDDFNLGSNDMEQNPRLKELTNKGFFRESGRDQYEGGQRIRALPIINDKGKAHAPEMDRSEFFQEFRAYVLSEPDEPLILKDHGHWVNPEEGFDVAEEQKDRRPDYFRRFDD
jgi:hypothetical protein